MEVGSGRGVAKSVVVGGGEIRRGEVGGEGFRDWRVAKGVPEGRTVKEGPAGRMGAGEGEREN
jgi:hypothetical protein